jgi:cytochrome c-type biogenesis protein CcmE
MKTYAKFAVLVVVIVGTLAWLAVGGMNESKAYYKTVAEVNKMGKDALNQRLRIAGDVEKGSILRQGKEVHFTLRQEQLLLPVVYDGRDPLPDTFKDGAQAVADGKLREDGVFQANKIQAKCASKYQGKPGKYQPKPGQQASLPASVN